MCGMTKRQALARCNKIEKLLASWDCECVETVISWLDELESLCSDFDLDKYDYGYGDELPSGQYEGKDVFEHLEDYGGAGGVATMDNQGYFWFVYDESKEVRHISEWIENLAGEG